MTVYTKHTTLDRMEISGLDLDAANINKIQRHGVSLEIIEAFFKKDFLIIHDSKHSEKETRFVDLHTMMKWRYCMKKLKNKKSKGAIDPLAKNLSEMIARSELIRASELFEFLPKNKTIALRLPEQLLKALQQKAKSEHKETQKLIREALIQLVNKAS